MVISDNIVSWTSMNGVLGLDPLFYCIFISLTSSLIIGGVYYLGQNLDAILLVLLMFSY